MITRLIIPHLKSTFSITGKKPLRFFIMISFMGVLLITVTSIVWYSQIKSSEAIHKISDDLVAKANNIIIEQTASYLMPASIMIELTANVMKNFDFTQEKNDTSVKRYMSEVIKRYSQLDMFNMGDERGNFMMAKKLTDGTVAIKIIDRTTKPPKLIWEYLDNDNNLIKRDLKGEIDFDPRTRPWYIGAKKSETTYWTNVYTFETDRCLGITASHPITDENNIVQGVISLDIRLDKISDFLNKLLSESTGIVFIINNKNEIISCPNISSLTKKYNAQHRLLHIDELENMLPETCLTSIKKGLEKFTFMDKGIKYNASLTSFPKKFGNDWRVGTIMKYDAFIAPIKTTRNVIISFIIFVLIGSTFILSFLSNSISKPISLIAEETHKIKNLCIDDDFDIKSNITEIQKMKDALFSLKTSLKSFSKYVPADLVRQLIKSGKNVCIGGKKQELTIFFSDIENFTSISEHLAPEELMQQVSEYFGALTKIIMDNKGTIDKYIGDSIMAFWGAPTPDSDHVINACKATLLCHKMVKELNEKWSKQDKPILKTRFGIHTDKIIVGNIGSENRMNYSLLGDGVNIASRLEEINKVFGSNIITSNLEISDKFLVRPLGKILLKGKDKEIMINELIADLNEQIPQEVTDMCKNFSTAIDEYLNNNWEKAIIIFKKIKKQFPSDKPTDFYIKNCQRNIKNPIQS